MSVREAAMALLDKLSPTPAWNWPEVHALRAALAEDEDARDAKRYRWLFPHDMDSVTARVNRVYRQWNGQSDWHAEVDAAMQEPRNGS